MVQVLQGLSRYRLRFDSSQIAATVRPTANLNHLMCAIFNLAAVFTTETIASTRLKSAQFEQELISRAVSILRWNPHFNIMSAAESYHSVHTTIVAEMVLQLRRTLSSALFVTFLIHRMNLLVLRISPSSYFVKLDTD